MIVEVLAILGVILFNGICYVAHERSILHKRLGLPVMLFVSNRHISSKVFLRSLSISCSNKTGEKQAGWGCQIEGVLDL